MLSRTKKKQNKPKNPEDLYLETGFFHKNWDSQFSFSFVDAMMSSMGKASTFFTSSSKSSLSQLLDLATLAPSSPRNSRNFKKKKIVLYWLVYTKINFWVLSCNHFQRMPNSKSPDNFLRDTVLVRRSEEQRDIYIKPRTQKKTIKQMN